jgi:two-component system response regulator RegA
MVSELVEDRERIALVVDDQKDEGLSCVAVLEAGGFVTHHVTDHREALARGRALNPECVVVACALRDADGFAVLRDLKSYDPRIRVVVVTSIGSIRAAVQAMKLGASDYLPKPVRAEELLSAVDPRRGSSHVTGEPEIATLARARFQYVQSVLGYTRGNVSEAARLLGLHRQSLQRMLRRKSPRP